MHGHIRKRHKPDCARRQDKKRRCNCDGSWQARMPDPDPTRPLNSELSKTFRTEQEAKDWLARQRGSQLDGSFIDPRAMERPFADVVTTWRESWPGRLSPTTERRYDSILRKYLEPELSRVPVGRITREVVQRYMNRLTSEIDPDTELPAHAPGTVRNVFAVLRTAMAEALALNVIRVNPCTGVRLPRARREEMLFLSADEVRAVAEAIDPQYRVLVYTAAWTGLRAGELAGLQRGDVDLLRGVLHVRRSLRDVNGRLEIGTLKTEHSRRTVSLPGFLKDMLREHLSSPATNGTGPEAYVFTMKGGSPLRHGSVYGRYFKRAVAGWTDAKGREHPGALPDRLHRLRWHDLRHTAVALAIQTGAHPKLIASRLGHSSITITLDRYGHLFPSMEEALAEALDAAFAAQPAASNVVGLLKDRGNSLESAT
jgi:integrase